MAPEPPPSEERASSPTAAAIAGTVAAAVILVLGVFLCFRSHKKNKSLQDAHVASMLSRHHKNIASSVSSSSPYSSASNRHSHHARRVEQQPPSLRTNNLTRPNSREDIRLTFEGDFIPTTPALERGGGAAAALHEMTRQSPPSNDNDPNSSRWQHPADKNRGKEQERLYSALIHDGRQPAAVTTAQWRTALDDHSHRPELDNSSGQGRQGNRNNGLVKPPPFAHIPGLAAHRRERSTPFALVGPPPSFPLPPDPPSEWGRGRGHGFGHGFEWEGRGRGEGGRGGMGAVGREGGGEAGALKHPAMATGAGGAGVAAGPQQVHYQQQQQQQKQYQQEHWHQQQHQLQQWGLSNQSPPTRPRRRASVATFEVETPGAYHHRHHPYNQHHQDQSPSAASFESASTEGVKPPPPLKLPPRGGGATVMTTSAARGGGGTGRRRAETLSMDSSTSGGSIHHNGGEDGAGISIIGLGIRRWSGDAADGTDEGGPGGEKGGQGRGEGRKPPTPTLPPVKHTETMNFDSPVLPPVEPGERFNFDSRRWMYNSPIQEKGASHRAEKRQETGSERKEGIHGRGPDSDELHQRQEEEALEETVSPATSVGTSILDSPTIRDWAMR